jgi:hypothetical protein
VVRVNQVGYATAAPKVAYVMLARPVSKVSFEVTTPYGVAYQGTSTTDVGSWNAGYRAVYQLSFSGVNTPGQYQVKVTSPVARHTVACLANAALPEEEAEHAAAVQAQGWSPTATVVNDTFAILRSGLPDGTEPHWGVAVVCGAGINAVGVAPDGRVTRYLALGTISGDWGGGYGLGLEVLWHAIRAEDGRGPATVLAQYLTGHFGVQRVEEITIGVHRARSAITT